MFTVIGEALVDVVWRPGAGAPVELVGGSPANVALGLARLGDPTGLITQYGPDPHGARIAARLGGAGVALDRSDGNATRTATATARLSADGAAAYEFDLSWAPTDLTPYPGSVAVHTGSLATLAPGDELLAATLAGVRDTTVVSYDPNVRPTLHGPVEHARAQVARFVALAHLVKASADDLDWLYPGEPVEAVAARWLAAGPALVVVTLGADGAFLAAQGPQAAHGAQAAHGSQAAQGFQFRIPAPPVAVVDTVGAGDACMSALLDGLYRAGALTVGALPALPPDVARQVLHRALTAAAITCGRPGADPPTAAELADRP